MSINIGYFFNWDGTLNQLKSEFREWIGCDLQPFEGDSDDLYCRFLGMEFSLRKQDHLENDRELNFEDFRFEVDFRTPMPDADFRPLQIVTLASLVYALYRRLGIAEGILVFDVQTLLARYEQRQGSDGGNRLFDAVSGEFVSYPRHFAQLMERMPKKSLSDEWESATVEYLSNRGYDVRISDD